jgi:four helix bundle protein
MEERGTKMAKAQSYRDLESYQISHRLAVDIHKLCLQLSKFELYEEGSQIRKSSKGIPSHIVEGFGRRRYKNDFIRFLVYAHSSCDETIEHLQLLFDTESIDEVAFEHHSTEYINLSKRIYRFIESVEREHLV